MLVVEAGGTKTNWLYGKDESPVCRLTSGFNPVFQSDEVLDSMILQLKNEISSEIDSIYYYGAGCFDNSYRDRIKVLLSKHFPQSFVEVRDDLSASVKALLGNSPGIAVILGTGTNSCKYDGTQIVAQIPSSGFILGDEGSGANLGRMLISAWLYGEFSLDLDEKASKWAGMDKIAYKKSFYSQESAGKYAAKWAIFARQNMDDSFISAAIFNNFMQFIERILIRYNPLPGQKIHFTGGMAWYFKDFLEISLRKFGLELGTVLQEPSGQLWQFHLQNKNIR
jgi:glucosamine kinase